MGGDPPRMECSDCGNDARINNVTEMPSFYCPECGARRHVVLDPSTPGDTKTDKI